MQDIEVSRDYFRWYIELVSESGHLQAEPCAVRGSCTAHSALQFAGCCPEYRGILDFSWLTSHFLYPKLHLKIQLKPILHDHIVSILVS